MYRVWKKNVSPEFEILVRDMFEGNCEILNLGILQNFLN